MTFFPKLKIRLKAVMKQLKAILIEDLQHGHNEWVQCLHKCVASDGIYIEEDNFEM